MNIHIFGHSICRRSYDSRPATFTDILAAQYNIQPHQMHIALCGSEERILYFLKKQKEPIDLAIIFHSKPGMVFVPTIERDISVHSGEHFWQESNVGNMQYFENISKDKSEPNISDLNKEDFKIAYNYLVKYFYTNDLNSNRHYGALVQIDQYLNHYKIPAIHFTLENTLPSWFHFTSGLVDTEITSMQKPTSQYYNRRLYANCIDEAGNKLIAEKITQYINRTAQFYPKLKSLVRLAGIEPTF